MLNFRYVRQGNLTKKEREGLYYLCLEEEKISKATPESNLKYYLNRVRNYYKIIDLGNFISSNFMELLDYSFIIVRDKSERVLGYLAFEELNVKGSKVDEIVFLVKHLFISNVLYREYKQLGLDFILFMILESIKDKCFIVSQNEYRPCTDICGYTAVKIPLTHETLFRLKKNNTFISFGRSRRIKLDALINIENYVDLKALRYYYRY